MEDGDVMQCNARARTEITEIMHKDFSNPVLVQYSTAVGMPVCLSLELDLTLTPANLFSLPFPLSCVVCHDQTTVLEGCPSPSPSPSPSKYKA